jgi:transketolase
MSHDEKLIKDLEEKAKTLRRHAINMINNAGMGWIGGSLSETEIITSLFFHHMKHDPKNPDWPERDRLILSKAHCCEMLYAALGEAGYFPKEHFNSYGEFGALLQAHSQTTIPGVEYSGGSLGTGLSFAVGEALANKIDMSGKSLDRKKFNVYCILGDGECDEGQVWEAALAGSHFNLGNLTAIIDRNDYQSTGKVVDIMGLEPFAEKWRNFSWHVIDIDGHDMAQIIDALNEANRTLDKPTAIIAHTIKGKGVPTFEERRLHFTKITEDMYSEAIEELK